MRNEDYNLIVTYYPYDMKTTNLLVKLLFFNFQFLPSEFSDEEGSLASDLTGGDDVTVAEEHPAVVHRNTRTTKF